MVSEKVPDKVLQGSREGSGEGSGRFGAGGLGAVWCKARSCLTGFAATNSRKPRCEDERVRMRRCEDEQM